MLALIERRRPRLQWRPDQDLLRVAHLGALVGVWTVAAATAAIAVHAYVFAGYAPLGFDAHAYWAAGRTAQPYDHPPEALDAFLYSPAFAQLVAPLALLPFGAFLTAWITFESIAFAWLLKPLGWSWGVPCMLLCVPELLLGNVIGLLAVCTVFGVRRGEAWT